MPTRTIEDYKVDELQDELVSRGLPHLRVRRRADTLTIESGPKGDVIRHARLRRETVHLWRLEIATSGGHWDLTPLRDELRVLLNALFVEMPWVLASRE